MVGVPGDADVIVSFSTLTRTETSRAFVGKDPHLSFNRRRWAVYSPNQGTNNVHVLSGFGLDPIDIIDIPGAHGAIMSRDSRRFYTTNLPGGGTDAIFSIDTRTHEIIGEPTHTPFAVPHNLALTRRGRKLYVTHSGATSDKVSVFRVSRRGNLTFETSVDVGLNPFGLAIVR